MSDQLSLILSTLMEIKQDIGSLQQDRESSVNQRNLLFSKVNELQCAVTSLSTNMTAHVAKFDAHAVDEEEIFMRVAAHETALAPFRDAKTKAIGVLALLALFGGGVGSQAEKLLGVLLGR